jgi:hypothetical protein
MRERVLPIYRETEASAVTISLTTNADGQFEIAGLDAGTYRLSFAGPRLRESGLRTENPRGYGGCHSTSLRGRL